MQGMCIHLLEGAGKYKFSNDIKSLGYYAVKPVPKGF